MNEEINQALSRLKDSNKYIQLFQRMESYKSSSRQLVFEALFADTFLINGIELAYEYKANPNNDKSVDFLYEIGDQGKVLFELASPNMSDVLQAEVYKNLYSVGVELSSDNPIEHLQPERQTIRMQDIVLGKTEKFPDASNFHFGVIVVDCINFHFAHFDHEDARIIMHGKPSKPYLTEHFRGPRIRGLLENDHPNKKAALFQTKITAIIFIPVIYPSDLLKNSLAVCNTKLGERHTESFKKGMSRIPCASQIKWVE